MAERAQCDKLFNRVKPERCDLAPDVGNITIHIYGSGGRYSVHIHSYVNQLERVGRFNNNVRLANHAPFASDGIHGCDADDKQLGRSVVDFVRRCDELFDRLFTGDNHTNDDQCVGVHVHGSRSRYGLYIHSDGNQHERQQRNDRIDDFGPDTIRSTDKSDSKHTSFYERYVRSESHMDGGGRCDVLPNHVDTRDDDSEWNHGNFIHIPWSDSRDTVHIHDSIEQRIWSERNIDDVERQMDTTGRRADNHSIERYIDIDRPHVDDSHGCIPVFNRVEPDDDHTNICNVSVYISVSYRWNGIPVHNHASKRRWRYRRFDDNRVGVLHASTSGDKPGDDKSSAPVYGTHVDGWRRREFVPRDVNTSIEHVHGCEHRWGVHIQWAFSRNELHVHAPIVQQHIGLW